MATRIRKGDTAVPPAGAAANPNAATRELLRGKRFLAADRAAIDLGEIATWDRYLLRERRLLAPIDVQALYVPPGGSEPMVRLPMLVAGAGGHAVQDVEDGMPDPFDPGQPRPAGVHLHWAMPDALLRGEMKSAADGAPNRLALPPLPDRWIVLRLLLPSGAAKPVVTGWVLEADRAIAVPLAQWTEDGAASASATPAGTAIDADALTGTVGGAVSWSGVYDAVLNRFAFHDPLDDVDALARPGVEEDCASYVVAGWWSDPGRDPLDAARSKASLHELLERMRWRLLYEWGDETAERSRQQAQDDLRKALGLTSAARTDAPRPAKKTARQARAAAQSAKATAYVPLDKTVLALQPNLSASVFAADAVQRFVAPAWQLRSCLLHGVIHGVPVRGEPAVDRRPDSRTLEVSLGLQEDDLLAALAVPGSAGIEARRAADRLLTAFTAQKVDRLGAADGAVELEEYEHGVAFASLPAGSAGNDRYLKRVQTGGVGGLALGRKRGIEVAARQKSKTGASAAQSPLLQAQTHFSVHARPSLMIASEAAIGDLARSRVGDVLTPTEARVVDRPAPRHAFPTEPMVAVRGASRSLRHSNDGRFSADGKLTCRWPSHVVSSIDGVIASDRFIASLGNGSIPAEVLGLAREALLHDPYHDEWIAAALAPAGSSRTALLKRLKAESVLRYGRDGTYDGATVAFDPVLARATPARAMAARQQVRAGAWQQQKRVADEMRRFSLFKGADPDPVGVTTWAQPWIPMWLEWEVKVEGLDPPSLEAWTLGAVDFENATVTIAGGTAQVRGRAQLATGAAKTLHDAIDDWLRKEDALDAAEAGLVDEDVEDSYRILADAVEGLDVVTATLDGLRHQLLGLESTDGLRRPAMPGGVAEPAPVAPPRGLLAGTLALTRARLLDAFGRTLEVPVDAVRTPARAAFDDRPDVLAMPPRLLRPARWQFRLVDAATPAGAEGIEARVDQIEPALQVSPVAGFLMPDHLDESLELFDAGGAPVGELLHEPGSGGVMWEIAAGREGPADAGPHYGLAPAQRALGDFAAALVAADAAARQGAALDPDGPGESALSAMLRAVDTTLWSVDSFASLGSEHVAGLVGRPLAMVRAQLRLELRPPEDIDLSDPQWAEAWRQAERDAARYAFPVRIGEITRSDDGVLGFFVDDDYSRFRLVDKAIAGAATESGRSRGQLGLYPPAPGMPANDALVHPYIAGSDDADTLHLHLGQQVTLTMLMHPAGKATLTSGLLPRKQLALARDWVGPGLTALAPSLRTGPVLVETDLASEGQVRLPKVSVFGKDQNFLWRDTPATWRTDAILAATQTALLPDSPAELREGWIRVAPDRPEGTS
ncbi:hypothetical protein MNQ95_14690 [Pseudoxanthomonas daejeonensis]|uniref:hypothetical protein n=1 Tax=Pseudoxanthomonas daejeonensis TaxID=266062 RepID=UPI001F5447FD|nr:hypothetical protein [Pseudoxanthomonas daejeonensis]UNK57360.1 hypothetical protein MNQ95_14690 [Pseudoxanthomonas daejeonensis]